MKRKKPLKPMNDDNPAHSRPFAGTMRRYRRALGRRFNARLKPYRFLIYAGGRSGSNSLVKILNCYAGIDCADEPFNADHHGNVRDRVTDLPSLRREIARLWRLFNGFKHVWHVSGWPFDGQPLLNDYIVTQAAATVILLHRKNLLQRIVSGDIGYQSQVWHVEDDGDRSKLLNHPFRPLDRTTIRERLGEERRAFTDVQRRLDQLRVPYKTVSYEELFSGASEEQKLSIIGELIAFITKVPFQRQRLGDRALQVMDPAHTRLNSAQTYELVPQIHEIEEEFGCEETGYLFR